MSDIPRSSNDGASEPRLISFTALKTIARQLPRYRHGHAADTGNAGGIGTYPGKPSGTGTSGGGSGGTLGRENKKMTRNITSGGLVTLDMVNGKLVSSVHGISLMQVILRSITRI